MKYILFEDFSGRPCPVMFPDRIRHEEMREQIPYSTILSAGYADMVGGKIVCHGASQALAASSAEGDAAIIAENFEPTEG